jgi:hypothetical protein
MVGALEVTGILKGPPPLTSDFTRLAALRLAAIGLCLGVTAVREEETFATPAMPFSGAFHTRHLRNNHPTLEPTRKEKD